MRRTLPFLLGLSLFAAQQAMAGTFYVATTGDNTSVTASEIAPLKTIKEALARMEVASGPHTLIIRGGLYREGYLEVKGSASGTSTQPTVIKAYPGERVVINGGVLLDDTALWEAEAGATGVWKYKDAEATTYRNVSIDGVPLRLMAGDDDFSSNAAVITDALQWSRHATNKKLWVKVNAAGDNPGTKQIEASKSLYTLVVKSSIHDVRIQDITLENAYYPIMIEGDSVALVDITARNAFGDAIKVAGYAGSGADWNSENGSITNCNLYDFGESGIDVTGGDYWSIRHCRIHNATQTRSLTGWYDGFKTNGIMIKNRATGSAVIENVFYDMRTVFGAVILGVDGYYDDEPTAEDTLVFGNIIDNIDGPYAISLRGARNSSVANNLIVNSTLTRNAPKSLIEFGEGVCPSGTHCSPTAVYFASHDNQVVNNVYYNNDSEFLYLERSAFGISSNVDDTAIDWNFRDAGADVADSYFGGNLVVAATLKGSLGFDTSAITVEGADFAGLADGLYGPSENSELLDTATSIGVTNAELPRAVARSSGLKADVGPYERFVSADVAGFANTSGWLADSANTGAGKSTVADATLGVDTVQFANPGTDAFWRFLDPVATQPTGRYRVSFLEKTLKPNGPGVAFDNQISFRVYTSAGEFRLIRFHSQRTTADLSNPTTILRFPLGGSAPNGGDWHRYRFDLQSKLQEGLNETIIYVERVYVNGGTALSMLQLDDHAQHSLLPYGLLSHWPLDEGKGTHTADVADVASPRHGVLEGILTSQQSPRQDQWAAGKSRFALEFDAAKVAANGDGVVQSGPAAVAPGSGITFSLWFNAAPGAPDYQTIISGLLGDTAYARVFQRLDSPGVYSLNLQFRMDGALQVVATEGMVEPGTWQHLVGVINPGTHKARVYIDGQRVDVWNTSTSGWASEFDIAGTTLETGSSPLAIGGDDLMGHAYNGRIDEVRIFDRPLLDEEVADLYALELLNAE